MDVEGIRALIADVLATLPPGAAGVEGRRSPLRHHSGAPEGGRDHLRLHVVPRAPDALDIAIDVHGEHGVVHVFVGDFLPIELTAPVDINSDPPRPALDVIREALAEATTGVVEGERTAPPWV
ncbi:hypothetical protein GB931_00345 [Modestobacter sp. I12A-02628]|uniref:Uncharacterized protein n=1 Tax=Goekera deserti TaxID=2497753 RepID=A0A7K3WK88_9ACTN|nr:hypothetical protein [Goekera deserti]MPQ96397.1 hypothetical protein [Goekera deserti]NDI47290.1 hypothetical protein [Goekera deserti]NEL56120.1 hypothetical protein [Goekera deserti]